jgi:aspartyl-tRNA(Asn)/glutamyl-tRNA(Gln) amidotransferase subunit C
VKVTEKDVQYVAELANVELTPPERERMVRDLNSILDYVDVLNELDTANVEPMAQTSDRFGVDAARSGGERFHYAMRDDVATPADGSAAATDDYSRVKRSLPRDEAMRNAPDTDGAHFKVPKVIER